MVGRGRVWLGKEWSEPDLNRRHVDFQSTALPTELPDRLLGADESFGKYRRLARRRAFSKPPMLSAAVEAVNSGAGDLNPREASPVLAATPRSETTWVRWFA